MILATIDNGAPDGQLVAVSRDHLRYLEAGAAADSLLRAVESWSSAAAELAMLSRRLEAGEGAPISNVAVRAPLPRSWQWLDGSAFATHGKLMQRAFGMDPIETDRPLMYQGMSDRFYAGDEDIPFPSEADGIDFEGEFAVIVDAVPMGTPAARALDHVKLVVQVNDWSLRAIAPVEMKTGFGWVQAKPACSMAPFAVTPDELGDAWSNARVGLDLEITLNGKRFGCANGAAMDFGFDELVAHAARTRDLVAGTIIGSGTVSNANYADVGSSCLSERRAIEMIESGSASTPFLRSGDRVRMAALTGDGHMPFGAIDQLVRIRPVLC